MGNTGKGKGKERGFHVSPLPFIPHASQFFISPVFSLISQFLTVSPLKEPLWRREQDGSQDHGWVGGCSGGGGRVPSIRFIKVCATGQGMGFEDFVLEQGITKGYF